MSTALVLIYGIGQILFLIARIIGHLGYFYPRFDKAANTPWWYVSLWPLLPFFWLVKRIESKYPVQKKSPDEMAKWVNAKRKAQQEYEQKIGYERKTGKKLTPGVNVSTVPLKIKPQQIKDGDVLCPSCGAIRGKGTSKCWADGCEDNTPYSEALVVKKKEKKPLYDDAFSNGFMSKSGIGGIEPIFKSQKLVFSKNDLDFKQEYEASFKVNKTKFAEIEKIQQELIENIKNEFPVVFSPGVNGLNSYGTVAEEQYAYTVTSGKNTIGEVSLDELQKIMADLGVQTEIDEPTDTQKTKALQAEIEKLQARVKELEGEEQNDDVRFGSNPAARRLDG